MRISDFGDRPQIVEEEVKVVKNNCINKPKRIKIYRYYQNPILRLCVATSNKNKNKIEIVRGKWFKQNQSITYI